MSTDLAVVPMLMRMAAHPLRWALLIELAAGDRRVRELAAAAGEPQNLVSYHLGLLRAAGLIESRRSSFDGRDSYYHLDVARCAAAFGSAAAALLPALTPTAATVVPASSRSVLFLCTGNSARSPMAEALLCRRGHGRIRVTSAGSHPKPRLHPNAVRVMHADYGLKLRRHPRPLTAVAGQRFDYVITLCDKVREFPRGHGSASAIHWSLPDPAAAAATDQASYPEFRRVATELNTRIDYLMPALTHHILEA